MIFMKDLRKKSQLSDKDFISKVSFLEYFNIPFLLSERLFSQIESNPKTDKTKAKNLAKKIESFLSRDFDEQLRMSFNIYDFDNDGVIHRDDVHLVMNNLFHTQDNFNSKKVNIRFNNKDVQYDPDGLNKLFQRNHKINFEKYKQIVSDKASDMFLVVFLIFSVICLDNFRTANGPSSPTKKSSYIERVKGDIEILGESFVAQPIFIRLKIIRGRLVIGGDQKKLNSDIRTTKTLNLQPNIIPLFKIATESTSLPKITFKQFESPKLPIEKKHTLIMNKLPIHLYSSNKEKHPLLNYQFVQLPTESIMKQIKTPSIIRENKNRFIYGSEPNAEMNYDIMRTESDGYGSAKRNSSIVKILKPFNSQNHSKKSSMEVKDFSLSPQKKSFIPTKIEVHFSGYLIRLKNKKLERIYCVLKNQLLTYYLEDDHFFPKGFVNLTNSFIKSEGEINLLNTPFYSFQIYHSLKRSNFLCSDADEFQEWTNWLYESTKSSETIANYTLIGVIGQGKFSVVHKAVNNINGREVAVKIVRKAKLTALDLISLRREISIMMECDHMEIVKIFGVDENYEYLYIMMEYFESMDLQEFCKKKNFCLEEKLALTIIFKVICLLEYLNDNGIMHRDIKPENILISKFDERCIKLIDFGLSRFLGKNTFVVNESFGTLAYAAPEILRNVQYDNSIDIFSTGVLTYFLLGGRLPFQGTSEEEIAFNSINCEYSFEGEVWDNISEESKELIQGMIKKESKERMTIQKLKEHPAFAFLSER